MALILYHLDTTTRMYMKEEILSDRMHKLVYLDHWLNIKGRKEFAALLTQAAQQYDDSWLAEKLAQEDRLHSRSWSQKGQIFLTKEISIQMAETAFNRYYIRALCYRALLENQEVVFPYKAKQHIDPLIEQQLQIKPYPSKQMLKEMREYVPGTSIVGIPGGPGSGISIQFL